jgi:hypothetical protein
MTEKAQQLSLEAGSKVSGAMKDVIYAAAGMTGFAIESARDLLQYMVRRGQMRNEEAEKLLREVEEAHATRKPGTPHPAPRPAAPYSPKPAAPAAPPPSFKAPQPHSAAILAAAPKSHEKAVPKSVPRSLAKAAGKSAQAATKPAAKSAPTKAAKPASKGSASKSAKPAKKAARKR